MYVRVLYQNKEYYSYVFGYFQLDYMDHYIVYDPIDNKFDIVAYFSKSSNGHRQIGFMNENEDDFIKLNELKLNLGTVYKCSGYPWLINNPSLINDINDGKTIDLEYVKLAKDMNSTINPDSWNEIITKEDADDMMYHVGGFHDWYLVAIEGNNDPYDCEIDSKLTLRFTSQAAFDVLLEFEQGIYIKYSFESNNRIYLSSIVLDDNHKYWVDGDEDLSISDLDNYEYIQGNKMRWKFILNPNKEW